MQLHELRNQRLYFKVIMMFKTLRSWRHSQLFLSKFIFDSAVIQPVTVHKFSLMKFALPQPRTYYLKKGFSHDRIVIIGELGCLPTDLRLSKIFGEFKNLRHYVLNVGFNNNYLSCLSK